MPNSGVKIIGQEGGEITGRGMREEELLGFDGTGGVDGEGDAHVFPFSVLFCFCFLFLFFFLFFVFCF